MGWVGSCGLKKLSIRTQPNPTDQSIKINLWHQVELGRFGWVGGWMHKP